MVLSASFAKFSDQTFKFTINSSSLELLWLPVPADIRKTIKPQISGTVKSVAEGVAGLGTFFLVKFIELQFLSLISIGAIAIWILTAFKVKTNYVKQLQTAIAKREINFEELNIDVQDAAMVKTIEDTLSSNDEIKQLFALEIIDGLPLSPWKKTIKKLFNNGSVDLRKRILELSWDEIDIISDEDIIQAIHKNDNVSPDAIIAAGKRRIEKTYPDIEKYLTDKNEEIVAASAASILFIDSGPVVEAEKILNDLISSSDEKTAGIALRRLTDNKTILTNKKLIKFLKSKSDYISNVALSIAEKRQDEELIPSIMSNLNLSKTALQARQALKKYQDTMIIDHFEKSLSTEETKRKLYLGILYAIREYPCDRSIEILLSKMDDDDQEAYNEIVDSLIAIARSHPIQEKKLEDISNKIQTTANKLYYNYELIKLLPDNEQSFLMKDYLTNEIQNTLPTLLKLGVMDKPQTPIESYINTIRTGIFKAVAVINMLVGTFQLLFGVIAKSIQSLGRFLGFDMGASEKARKEEAEALKEQLKTNQEKTQKEADEAEERLQASREALAAQQAKEKELDEGNLPLPVNVVYVPFLDGKSPCLPSRCPEKNNKNV